MKALFLICCDFIIEAVWFPCVCPQNYGHCLTKVVELTFKAKKQNAIQV